ncbi:MAG: TRAM domain-containing protein [Candidatus Marsarchaeota archaeon]|jgi:23S rRNA (uracil1939-C5)-methyltransferase|nr:TRAM domain-containing protein [Candidatus Marsarchaeota archaeon]
MEPNFVEIGATYEIRIDAKGVRDEGIGKVGNFIIFIKDAKTRIGNMYKVKITKVYRTFAYGELVDINKPIVIQ